MKKSKGSTSISTCACQLSSSQAPLRSLPADPHYLGKVLYLAIARPWRTSLGDLSVLASILAIGVGHYFAAYCHEVHSDGLSIVALTSAGQVHCGDELTNKPSKVALILASLLSQLD
jgi:hypothetical protein